MRIPSALLPLALGLASFAPAALAQESAGAPAPEVESESPGEPEVPPFDWLLGPATGDLGGAQVAVPEGYRFLGAEQTRRILELMGNIPDGDERGALFPGDDDWFVVFEFEEVGYVEDDEKDALDADALLETMKQGSRRGNELRRERGLPAMNLIGWAEPPHYDETTHNLEWAIRFDVEGEGEVVNQNTRLLGRKGVMSATLVAAPEELAAAQPRADQLLAGFEFTAGNRYAEFRRGDKIAQYGLAGLVLGGAAAAAIKTGLLKKFWKLIVLAVVGAGAAVKRLFGRKDETALAAAPPPPPTAPG